MVVRDLIRECCIMCRRIGQVTIQMHLTVRQSKEDIALYPQITMGAHVSIVPNHQTGRSTSLDARYQVARLFNLGYELDLIKCSEEERKEIACSLLADGELSYEKIAKHTGFTVEEIQKLAAQK